MLHFSITHLFPRVQTSSPPPPPPHPPPPPSLSLAAAASITSSSLSNAASDSCTHHLPAAHIPSKSCVNQARKSRRAGATQSLCHLQLPCTTAPSRVRTPGVCYHSPCFYCSLPRLHPTARTRAPLATPAAPRSKRSQQSVTFFFRSTCSLCRFVVGVVPEALVLLLFLKRCLRSIQPLHRCR